MGRKLKSGLTGLGFKLTAGDVNGAGGGVLPPTGGVGGSPIDGEWVAYATAADIAEGIDGALGAIEMGAAVMGREIGRRFRETLPGFDAGLRDPALGLDGVKASAKRREFGVLVVVGPASLGDGPDEVEEVLSDLLDEGVLVYGARTGWLLPDDCPRGRRPDAAPTLH